MRRLFIALVLALFSATLLAGNTITVSSASGAPGEEVTIDVSLNNSDAVVAAEIRIPLNHYIQYVEESAVLNPERSNGHQLSAASVDNELRLYVYGFGTNALKGSTGKLCSFRLKLGKNPEAWTMTPNVVLSDAQGGRLTANAVNGQVTILVPQLTVETPNIDYGHVPIRSTYTRNVTLHNSGTSLLTVNGITFSASEFTVEESSFSIEAGATKDLTVHYAPTKHGEVSETLTIVSDASNGKQLATLVADPYSVNELHVGNASGVSDGEVTIPITMNNMEPIAGAQWSFILTDALRYVDGSIQTAEHSEGLSANTNVVGNKLTCYLYTTSNTKIEEGEGAIATIKLRLQGMSGTYYLTPSEVVLSNAAMENMVSTTTSGRVSISSPRMASATTLDMGSCSVTETASKTYSMYNAGSAPLVVSRVTFLAEGYSIAEEFPLTIESGESKDITVSYQGTAEGNYSTTMQIYSNDPNERMKSVAVSGTLFEPNVLSMSSVMCDNAKDYAVFIGMKNYTPIVALQAEIVGTKPFTLDPEEIVKSDRLDGLSVTVSKMSDRKWRLLIYSLNNTSISGNEGDLLTLTLHPATEDTDLNKSVVSLENILLSNSSSSNKYSGDAVSTELHVKQFKVTFIAEGETIKEETLDYGSAITAPENPTKTGYTFVGWSPEVDATVPVHDVTYVAQFTINQYMITFDTDGGSEVATITLDYGTEITSPADPTKEGYTFAGWDKVIPSTMPAENLTITALWTINTYKLTYKVDGEVYKEYEVEYNSAITPEEEPEKEGYTFSGWSEIPETMPANDVEVVGTFTVNKYKVTFISNGETIKEETLDFGSTIEIPENPTKIGYTFIGWSPEVDATVPAHDVTYTAQFTINQYTITFDTDGGSEVAPITQDYGTEITPPADPTKEGYTFTGWDKEIPSTMPAENLTIKALWTINKYKLTYKVDGEVYKEYEVEYNSAITPEEEPEKEGYTFSGWSEIPATMPANDVEVVGTFTVNQYKVTFISNGETIKEETLDFGSTIEIPENPTKTGYTFVGWSPEVDGTVPAHDVTYVAQFTINQYTITFDTDGGSEVSSITQDYGTEITSPADPTKEGYTFAGWDKVIPSTMPAENLTITALWTINMYKLMYKVDGEVYKEYEVEYNSVITPEEEPEKEGYTFSGWSEIPETMPANDVEVVGTFTINQYKVTFISDGEVIKEDSLDFGAEITAPDDPTKTGYTFTGWSPAVDATVPAHDVIYEAQFEINTYKLTYYVDGEVYKEFEIEYGSEIIPEENPVKEGYTFSGWSDIPKVMPDHNVEVYGTFTSSTGINDIKFVGGNERIYDLSGKVVNRIRKGINIINGKKVLVK